MLICLRNNILFRARHIKGARNILADSLSRFAGREIQSPGTGYEPRANPSTGETATRELGDTLTQLLEASLSATSLSTYRRPWYLYRDFQADKLQIQGPIFPILSEAFGPVYCISSREKVCFIYSIDLHFSFRLSSSTGRTP